MVKAGQELLLNYGKDYWMSSGEESSKDDNDEP